MTRTQYGIGRTFFMRWICLATLLLTGIQFAHAQPAPADTQPTTRVIRFDGLQLRGVLPYQESFIIRGSRNVFLANADAGILTVSRGRQKDNGEIEVDTEFASNKYFWWVKTSTDADFEFYVDQGLAFNKHYVLEFEFFQKASASADLKKRLKAELVPLLAAYYTGQLVIGPDDVKDEIEKLLTSALTNSAAAGHEVGTLTIGGGKVAFIQQTPNLATIDFISIAHLISLKKDLEDKELELRNHDATTKSLNPDFDAFSNILTAGASPVPFFTPDEINELKAYHRSLTPLTNTLLGRISRLRRGRAEPPIIEVQDFSQRSKQHDDMVTALAPIRLQVAQLTVKFEGSIDDLVLDQVFVAAGSGIAVGTKTEGVTIDNVINTRFGVVAGAGTVALNLHIGSTHGPVEYQPFAYLGVKYYFHAVDKRVQNPWLETDKLLPKWAIMVGWKVAGTITYQGKNLNDVIGMKPVVGLSWDMTRFISMDFLGMFYKQQAMNPFDTTQKLTVSPCLTLSADVDLVNRLRQLLSKSPYGATPPRTNSTTN